MHRGDLGNKNMFKGQLNSEDQVNKQKHTII